MRTSGIASERPLTIAVFLIAVGFLMVLAGGPSEFFIAIERALEAVVAMARQVAQGLHW
jgi:hypothetical protein